MSMRVGQGKDMSIDKAQARATILKYDDDYKALDRIRAMSPGVSDLEIGEVLWELLREGCAQIGSGGNNFWTRMLRSGASFDAEDLLLLLEGIAEGC